MFLKPYVITCFLHSNSEMLLLLLHQNWKAEEEEAENVFIVRECWEMLHISTYFANLAPFYQQLKNIMFQFFQSIFPILFAFFNLRTARSDMNSNGIVWEIEQKQRLGEREQTGNMHVRYISRLPHTQTHTQRQGERDGGRIVHRTYTWQGHWNTCVVFQQKKKKRKVGKASGSDLSPTLWCVFYTFVPINRHTHTHTCTEYD